MKKRNLFLVLALALTLCLTACGEEEDKSEKKSKKDKEKVEEVQDKDKTKDPMDDLTSAQPENSQTVTQNRVQEKMDEYKVSIPYMEEQMEAVKDRMEAAGIEVPGRGGSSTQNVKQADVSADLSTSHAGLRVTGYTIEQKTIGSQTKNILRVKLTFTNKMSEDRSFKNSMLYAYQNGIGLNGGVDYYADSYTAIQNGVSINVEECFDLRDTTSAVELKFWTYDGRGNQEEVKCVINIQ